MYISQMRGRRVGGEEPDGLIPGFLDAGASAIAGFVTAREEDHPFLWALGGIGGLRRRQHGLPIRGFEGYNVVLGGFCCAGSDGGGVCGRNVGFCFFNP